MSEPEANVELAAVIVIIAVATLAISPLFPAGRAFWRDTWHEAGRLALDLAWRATKGMRR